MNNKWIKKVILKSPWSCSLLISAPQEPRDERDQQHSSAQSQVFFVINIIIILLLHSDSEFLENLAHELRSELVSERAKRAVRSKQRSASGASERASGWVSGPLLTSRFLDLLNHCVLVQALIPEIEAKELNADIQCITLFSAWRKKSNVKCGQTDGRSDTPCCRDARLPLKIKSAWWFHFKPECYYRNGRIM